MHTPQKLNNSIEEINSKLDKIQKLVLDKVKPFLNMDECSAYTGIPKATIYGFVSKGIIPFHKLNGKRTYFDKDEIDRFILNSKNRYKSNSEIEAEASQRSQNY